MTTKALAKKSPPASLTKLNGELTNVLTKIATSVTNLKDNQLASAHKMLKAGSEALDAMDAMVRSAITKLVIDTGEKITEKGSMSAVVENTKLTIQPNRTGYDPKKIEELLRMRGCAPEVWMDTKVTYVVNEGKLDSLVKLGDKVSKDELETCRYAVTYRVMPVEDVTNE